MRIRSLGGETVLLKIQATEKMETEILGDGWLKD